MRRGTGHSPEHHLLMYQGSGSERPASPESNPAYVDNTYAAAHRTLMPTVNHLNHAYASYREEVPHDLMCQRERHTSRTSSPTQAQRFLTLHGPTHNLFRLGRHLIQAVNYRLLRTQAFQVWQEVVCA